MQVHRDINHLPPFKNAVMTIGTFDGVHLGHLQIIHQLKKEAAAAGGESVIITFDPHPRIVLQAGSQPSNPIKLLTTLEEKIMLLERHGVDHLVVVPFTLEFAFQAAEEYIRNFLVNQFHPYLVIIGYDHRFGKDRAGNYRLLETYGAQLGYRVQEIPEHVLHHVVISSTNIRKALREHDMQTANDCLGYSYFFEGTVTGGDRIGRTLGYPTANLVVRGADKLIPADGIYAVRVAGLSGPGPLPRTDRAGDATLPGMMSIGVRPTVGGTSRVIEVNIFDFDREIYGETLQVFVEHYLRPEIRFDTLEQLRQQIGQDKIDTLEWFGRQ